MHTVMLFPGPNSPDRVGNREVARTKFDGTNVRTEAREFAARQGARPGDQILVTDGGERSWLFMVEAVVAPVLPQVVFDGDRA